MKKKKKPVKVVFECAICGAGLDGRGLATAKGEDGKDYLIQNKKGGFICKKCWAKFKHFCSRIVLCGAESMKERK